MKRIYKFWLGVIISGFFIALFLIGVNIKEIWVTLKDANYFFVLLAVCINVLTFMIRAARWEYLLDPIKKVNLDSLFSAVCIGFMGNSLLPARAGEFIRAYVIGKREKISKTSSLATIALERLFDTFTLFLMLLIVASIFSFPGDGSGGYITKGRLNYAVFGVSIFLSLAASMLILLLWKPKNVWDVMNFAILRYFPVDIISKIEGIYHSFILGLESLKKGKHILIIIIYSVVLWLVTAAGIFVLFPAFSIRLTYLSAILVMTIVAVVIMLPSSPGYIGTFHLASSETLIFLGIKISKAKSFAIIHHASCIVPVVFLGLFYLSKESISFKEISYKIDRDIDKNNREAPLSNDPNPSQ